MLLSEQEKNASSPHACEVGGSIKLFSDLSVAIIIYQSFIIFYQT